MADLICLRRVVADGYHNAFTDLTRWRDHYYLSYRHAQSHGIEPPGDVVVLRSADLSDWEEVARFDTGADDRDPKLLDAGQRLAVSFASWYPRWRSATSLTDVDLGVMIHAPVMLHTGGRWIVAGRSQEEDLPEGAFESYGERPDPAGHHTSVWEIDRTRARHLITVPSGRDCSYCGLAMAPDGKAVAMSYYSQHERLPLPTHPPTPSDVFLATVTV